MAKKKTGRVMTVFLVIAVILLFTGTAMALFFQQMEMRERKSLEDQLAGIRLEKDEFQKSLEDSKAQVFLLEDKNREADERINSLLDELDLEKGLREEMRLETVSLREALNKETAAKGQLTEQLTKIREDYEKRIQEMDDKLRQEVARAARMEVEMQALKRQSAEMFARNEGPYAALKNSGDGLPPESAVDLEQILVAPGEIPQGRVISIDTDMEFIIISLGSQDGIESGRVLSVYRAKEYLGEVKVTRVQPDMSAAEFVPPFSSQLVRKDDQVVAN
jgi:hypothetical protein